VRCVAVVTGIRGCLVQVTVTERRPWYAVRHPCARHTRGDDHDGMCSQQPREGPTHNACRSLGYSLLRSDVCSHRCALPRPNASFRRVIALI